MYGLEVWLAVDPTVGPAVGIASGGKGLSKQVVGRVGGVCWNVT